MKSREIVVTEQGAFRKYYTCREDAEREKQVYNMQLPIMPALLGSGRADNKDYCDFEFLESVNLWQKAEINFGEIAKLYSVLHSRQNIEERVLCQIDTNPQNIVYVGSMDRYFLVDFVDWRMEYAEFDLIHFLLFWAAKKSAVQYCIIQRDFITAYLAERCIDYIRWQALMPEVMNYFDARRKYYGKNEKHLSEDHQANRLYLSGLPGL